MNEKLNKDLNRVIRASEEQRTRTYRMNYKPDRITKYWRLSITVRPSKEDAEKPDNTKWARNISLGIVAKTCSDAIRIAEEQYPGHELHSVNCSGDIHHLL